LYLDAWHVVSTTDPLLDSDEETDHHVRLDYSRLLIMYLYSALLIDPREVRRLKIISRLRGQSPTPEREHSTVDDR
jgi:Ino eighty subunit 1